MGKFSPVAPAKWHNDRVRAVLVAMLVTAGIASPAGIARAQAPGQSAPVTSPAPPPAAPAAPEFVDRWSIGLGLSLISLTPDAGDAKHSGFAAFDLAAHYRISAPIELAVEVDLGGGNNTSLGGIVAGGRYTFRPFAPWSWYVLAHFGVTSVAAKDASDVNKQARATLHLGGGIQRRWGRWTGTAELRFIGIGANRDARMTEAEPEQAWLLERYGLVGFSLGIAAAYSF